MGGRLGGAYLRQRLGLVKRSEHPNDTALHCVNCQARVLGSLVAGSSRRMRTRTGHRAGSALEAKRAGSRERKRPPEGWKMRPTSLQNEAQIGAKCIP